MMLFEYLLVHPWLVIESFKICFTNQFDQVLIASQVSGQEDEVIVIVVCQPAVLLGMPTAERHVGFAADDGFDADLFRFAVELDGAEHVAMIGHRHGRLSEGLDLLNQRFNLIGAVEKTELGVQMQVDERSGHGTRFYVGSGGKSTQSWRRRLEFCA